MSLKVIIHTSLHTLSFPRRRESILQTISTIWIPHRACLPARQVGVSRCHSDPPSGGEESMDPSANRLRMTCSTQSVGELNPKRD